LQIQSLVSQFSTVDVLINSAAFMPGGNVEALTLENWDTALDLNLRAPFLLARECAKKMNAGGLIVNITDVGAQKAWSRYPSYTISKAALESLTKILARALAPSEFSSELIAGLRHRYRPGASVGAAFVPHCMRASVTVGWPTTR